MNKIIYISNQKMVAIREEIAKNHKHYVVEIDGASVKDTSIFFNIIEQKLKFPRSCEMMMDRFLDWMRDLSWLEDYNALHIIIHNSIQFLSNDVSTKETIMHHFENTIFPWWEKDVETFCAGGKRKEFKLYMVE